MLAYGVYVLGPRRTPSLAFGKTFLYGLSVTTRTFFSYGKVMMEIVDCRFAMEGRKFERIVEIPIVQRKSWRRTRPFEAEAYYVSACHHE